MKRTLFVVAVLALIAVHANSANAQTPRVELTFFPGGMFIAAQGKTSAQPRFDENVPGVAVSARLTPLLAVEGEIARTCGGVEPLEFDGRQLAHAKTPVMLGYSAHLVIAPVSQARIQPYLAAGAGAIRISPRAEVGIDDAATHLTVSAGGGAKVMFGRWGLRADYRLVRLSGRNESTPFIGTSARLVHRLYGGVVLTSRGTKTTR